MGIAVTDEQVALAEAVSAFAARVAPVEDDQLAGRRVVRLLSGSY